MSVGRPSLLTPEVQDTIVKAILLGNYREVAAGIAGVSPFTFARWMRLGKADPESNYGKLRQAVLEAERTAEAKAVERVFTAPDLNSLWKWLERKFPGRWGRDNYRIREVERQLEELKALLGKQGAGPDPQPPTPIRLAE